MQIGWESGIFDYWFKKYEPKIDKCLLDSYKDAAPKLKALSLVDMSGPFIILLLGLSLSLVVFLVELAWNFNRSRRQANIIVQSKREEVVKEDN